MWWTSLSICDVRRKLMSFHKCQERKRLSMSMWNIFEQSCFLQWQQPCETKWANKKWICDCMLHVFHTSILMNSSCGYRMQQRKENSSNNNVRPASRARGKRVTRPCNRDDRCSFSGVWHIFTSSLRSSLLAVNNEQTNKLTKSVGS